MQNIRTDLWLYIDVYHHTEMPNMTTARC